MSNTEKSLKIKLGTDLETNTFVDIDLLAEPHVLLTGEIGVDVSEYMKDFVFQLMENNSPDEIQFSAVISAHKEITEFRNSPFFSTAAVTRNHVEFLRQFREEFYCRNSYLMKAKAITVSEYNKKIELNPKWAKDNNLPYLPYRILLVDDFDKLIESGDVEDYIRELLVLGRNAGVFLILVSAGKAFLIGGEIEVNTSTQISLLKNGEALVNKRGNVFKVEIS